jgi:hypothetical protein
MPAMAARLALRPDRRTVRTNPQAKASVSSATHMQHASTVPRAQTPGERATQGELLLH